MPITGFSKSRIIWLGISKSAKPPSLLLMSQKREMEEYVEHRTNYQQKNMHWCRIQNIPTSETLLVSSVPQSYVNWSWFIRRRIGWNVWFYAWNAVLKLIINIMIKLNNQINEVFIKREVGWRDIPISHMHAHGQQR